jgi:acetolactate synthase-1/2/3 large subunit
MEFGPGVEDAFTGVATAFSDSVPVLLLSVGHKLGRAQLRPHFSSVRSYSRVTKHAEQVTLADEVPAVIRRAFSQLRTGRSSPVLVEIPADLALENLDFQPDSYHPVKRVVSAANQDDVMSVARVLSDAQNPLILAGQGVLYAEASRELCELAELLHIPVMTTLGGKSAFPENHPLSLGTGAWTATEPVVVFMERADVVFAVGTGLTRHGGGLTLAIPPGKTIIHSTNDPADINKDYRADHALLGDAKLVLRQLIFALKEQRFGGGERHGRRPEPAIRESREQWLNQWMPKLTSTEVPINPYRIIWELMMAVRPDEAVVTHDVGSTRDQLSPFYVATMPHGYIGWGESHAMGAGLGLIMGAKLADPSKFCINFMGEIAFGMTGLEFETAVRCGIAITTIVMRSSAVAGRKETVPVSREGLETRYFGGNYSEMGRAMGGYAERVENPEEIAAAIGRARKANGEGTAALLEFVTSEETNYSHVKPF